MMKNSASDNRGRAEQVAALPWRLDSKGKLRILLVTSRTNGKWMLPKGWPMDGKSPSEAAQIEAREEAGVEGEVSDNAIGSFRYIKLFGDGTSTHAQALVYPVRVTSVLPQWDEKHQRSRNWLRPKKAAEMVFEPDLRRFLLALRDESLVLFD